MRCKMTCNRKDNSGDGVNLVFSPVITGSEENKSFFQATPGGQITLHTVNHAFADKIETGRDYYVDFTLVK